MDGETGSEPQDLRTLERLVAGGQKRRSGGVGETDGKTTGEFVVGMCAFQRAFCGRCWSKIEGVCRLTVSSVKVAIDMNLLVTGWQEDLEDQSSWRVFMACLLAGTGVFEYLNH